MRFLFSSPSPVVNYGLAPALNALGQEIRITDYRSGQQQDHNYLPNLIADFQPDHIFTVGGWQIDNKFFSILSSLSIPHTFWAFDDPPLFKIQSLSHARSSQYVYTTAAECISLYKKHGIDAHLLMFACLPSFHYRVSAASQYAHDCILVGNNYDAFPGRLKGIDIILKPLMQKRYDVKIYGNEWWLDQERPFFISKAFYGGYLGYELMRTAYSSAKIVLGIHSVDTSPTMMSMRTYEVLGCGAFFLTQWTPSIERYFRNHVHLVWSKSPEETIELVDYYLAHPEEREKIARGGQKEVYTNHTYLHRAKDILTRLNTRHDEYRKSWVNAWSGSGAKSLRPIQVKKLPQP